MDLEVSADLRFDLDVEGGPAVHGRLTGEASRLVLEIDRPGALAGGRDAPAVRALAEGLAAQGVAIRVVSGGRHLVSIGAVSAPWWQRRVTGSRRIRIGSLRGALTSARARTRETQPALPDAALAPPATLWPPAPTFQRRPRRRVTTTHDPAGGGGPRLVPAVETVLPGARQPVFWLADRVTIGSGEGADIRLPGLEEVHAVIEHDGRDEYVVTAVAGVTRVHGAPVERALLRTGARLEVGDHRLVYYREEYADHGRPYGGRLGGEAGYQRPQPPREAR
ncbi:FHA domain-containing protein [Nocardioides sp. YIM 152588]|uniref:FHA domain-containing protein n=1 Tax=Nocardioides sp. YIM 152588 TaxID=3158259 RepID=UPI0032E4816B